MVSLLLLLAGWSRPAPALGRDDEPVTVPGSAVPELSGQPLGRFGVFRYDTTGSAFVAIPYQVDERLVREFTGPLGNFTENVYDVFGEDNGGFDTLDEIVFLFGDAGPQAPGAAAWPAGADGRRYEIRVSDPRPLGAEPDRYVYVFTGTGLAQSPTSYVSWDTLATSTVSSDAMALDYTDRWLLTGYRVLGCGSGADLIDRLKARAGIAPNQAETEEEWNLASSYLGGIVGPVRAIRYVRGAASGFNTVHHDRIYRTAWQRRINLRVHSVSAVWHYVDWLPLAGLTLYTPTRRTGEAQDGSPDGALYSSQEDWHLLRSPAGGMVFHYDIPPSPFYGVLEQYLRDDVAYNDAPLSNPTTYPDEDDSAYGNHGFRMSVLSGSDLDTIVMNMKLWSLCGGVGDADLGDDYQEREDFPLAPAATVERTGTGTVDLSLTKTVDNPAPDVGTNVVFTITVSNAAGFDAATGLAVLDELPSGYDYVSDDGGGAYDGVTGLWSVGTLAAGTMATLNVTARAKGTGVHLNEAQVVTADQDDVDDTYADGAGEEYDAASTTPTPVIDLALSKVVDDGTPPVDGRVVFGVTVSNDPAFSDATGVVVRDLLPSGYQYVADDGLGSYAPATGIWTVGPVGAGDARTLNITADVLASGVYLNEAEVTAADQVENDDVYDDGAGEDYDTATTTPGPASSDLRLAKTVDNPTPEFGQNVIFTLTVTNDGPSNARGVEVTDLLPSGYQYISHTGGSYDSGTGLWTVGSIAPGAAAALNITANVNSSGDYLNTAEVTAADYPDPDSTPNNGVTTEDDYAERSTSPQSSTPADLSLTKTVDDPGPSVGDNVVFTLTVTNDGPSPVDGVKVLDPLPAGYTYVGDDSGGNYDDQDGEWDVGFINPGGSRTLNITAQVNAGGSHLNTAEVSDADRSDPDSTPGNGDPTEDDWAEASTTPNAVRTLTASRDVNDVVLDWLPMTSALSYRVYASSSPDVTPKSSWTLLGEVTATQYRDVGAVSLGDRYYSVVVVTASGEGPH